MGVVGLIATTLFAVVGWILVGRVSGALLTTFEPMSEVVVNISDTIGASQRLVSRTTEALTSIEGATRSTASTVESVNEILGETAALAGGEIADSLDSAVGSLPGVISTARVVDRTMRTLSLLGVDYDPDQPLDESLAELEASLRPVPDQIRDQAELLEDARSDIDLIVSDAGELAAVLLRARVELRGVEQVLADVAANAADASAGVQAIESDLDTYETAARALMLLATIALLVAAATPLVIGIQHMRDSGERT
jgi:hypothetical protein